MIVAKKKPFLSKEYGLTKHLLNPKRRYVGSLRSDIRLTFRRIRKAAKALANGNVVQIRSKQVETTKGEAK